MIEDLRDEFKSDSKVYEKKYVDSDLNKKLNNELRESGFTSMYELKNDFGYSVRCFKDYYFNTNSYDKKTNEFKFYEEKPMDLGLDDLKTIMIFQNNKSIKKIEKNIYFIDTFLKVWLVISLIAILVIFFVNLKGY